MPLTSCSLSTPTCVRGNTPQSVCTSDIQKRSIAERISGERTIDKLLDSGQRASVNRAKIQLVRRDTLEALPYHVLFHMRRDGDETKAGVQVGKTKHGVHETAAGLLFQDGESVSTTINRLFQEVRIALRQEVPRQLRGRR